MYINGMRNGNGIKNRNMAPTEVLVGVIIPFILFWGGIMSPFYTDNILIWIFSLVPFYVYLFACSFVKKEMEERVVAIPYVLNIATSVILLMAFFFIPGELETLRNACKMGIVNILPSILFLFFLSVDCSIKGFSGIPFPIIPFIVGSDS